MTMTQTQGTQASAAQAALAAINNFLSIAPRKYTAILGTIASGSAGGSNANVIWQQQIPIVPAFCTAIDYNITLEVALTQQSANALTLSPYAPYSIFANQLTLGGAPPWPLTELLPWYLDQVQHHVNYDPNYPGLGNNEGIFAAIIDQGPSANLIGGTGTGTSLSIAPGVTVTATGTGTTNYYFQWKVRQQLQRKRHLLWGAVPFGDPENRPANLVQMLPLIGTNPEQCMFVNAAATGTASSVASVGTTNVYAEYELAYVDLLPPSMTAVPNPQVGYGLQMIQFSTTNLTVGTTVSITHRTAMIYTSIHQLLISGELGVRGNYFGLWDDQDVQSSRWNFDSQVNTFTEYFDTFQRNYRRYPLTGQYVCDFEGGIFPEIPSVTPYDALMSPDQSYANAFGVPVTPAMTTALRLGTGTGNTGSAAPYVRTYSFGLVRVPY